MAIPIQVTFDAADPAALGTFWAKLLGYVEHPPPEGFDSWDAALEAWDVPEDQRDAAYAIVDPDGVGPKFYFQRVPESKVGKNRVHVDVNVSRPGPMDARRAAVDATVARAIELGATRGETVDRDGYWVVMTDPEGNEFCVA
jgi:hypothetical protein